MFMLLLHISAWCDIIAMHLFESYPKTDKIHAESGPQYKLTPKLVSTHHNLGTQIKRPDLRDGSFLVDLLLRPLKI